MWTRLGGVIEKMALGYSNSINYRVCLNLDDWIYISKDFLRSLRDPSVQVVRVRGNYIGNFGNRLEVYNPYELTLKTTILKKTK